MNLRIVACAWVAVLAAQTSPAGAAVWVWGCKGQLESEQVIFTKFSLLVAPLKPSRGHIRDIIRKDNLVRTSEDEKNSYDAMNDDFGLVPVMKFARDVEPDKKVTFTEQSSHRASRRARLTGGRDESTEMFKKVYRYVREDQPPRDITMDCVEYQLSTRGGRR
jgi:hypothetical protein